jgi:DNA primase
MQQEDLGPLGAALVQRLLQFHANEDSIDLATQLNLVLDKLELQTVDDELKLMAETGDLSEAALVRARELNRRRADLKQRLLPGGPA